MEQNPPIRSNSRRKPPANHFPILSRLRAKNIKVSLENAEKGLMDSED
jgi:hypothetical protein